MKPAGVLGGIGVAGSSDGSLMRIFIEFDARPGGGCGMGNLR